MERNDSIRRSSTDLQSTERDDRIRESESLPRRLSLYSERGFRTAVPCPRHSSTTWLARQVAARRDAGYPEGRLFLLLALLSSGNRAGLGQASGIESPGSRSRGRITQLERADGTEERGSHGHLLDRCATPQGRRKSCRSRHRSRLCGGLAELR